MYSHTSSHFSYDILDDFHFLDVSLHGSDLFENIRAFYSPRRESDGYFWISICEAYFLRDDIHGTIVLPMYISSVYIHPDFIRYINTPKVYFIRFYGELRSSLFVFCKVFIEFSAIFGGDICLSSAIRRDTGWIIRIDDRWTALCVDIIFDVFSIALEVEV